MPPVGPNYSAVPCPSGAVLCRRIHETAALQRQGAISADSYLVECPYNPVWTARRPVTILGRTLRAGSQFAYNHHGGKGDLLTSFRSAPDFEECQGDD
jgi:hypothetical protein